MSEPDPLKLIEALHKIGSLDGKCYAVHCVLKEAFPQAEGWHDEDHVITRINGKFYDKTGEVQHRPYLPDEVEPIAPRFEDKQMTDKFIPEASQECLFAWGNEKEWYEGVYIGTSIDDFPVVQCKEDSLFYCFEDMVLKPTPSKADKDALVARVARLESHARLAIDAWIESKDVFGGMTKLKSVLSESEQQSLAEIRAAVIYEFKSWLISKLGNEGVDADDCDIIVSQSEFDDYANQLRQQAKGGG